jgi:putative transposase
LEVTIFKRKEKPMVNTNMDLMDWLGKQAENAEAGLLREMLSLIVHMLMDAETTAICGADYRERTDERANSRNGYRERALDTRAGTIELAIPKLRKGSYFPSWFLEPKKRAEQALVSVVADCYLGGVSTRRVDKLVKTMGIEEISRSQVSRMAESLDEIVESFRNRPLDAHPYTYLWLDAQNQKSREAGRVVNVATVTAIGVNSDGRREVLGMDVFTSEDGAGWTAFLRGLVARGLKGVKLVISDAHPGLKDAIASVLPGASWQRCRAHFMRNLMSKVPKAAQDLVATCVRSIFAQPDKKSVCEQHSMVVRQLEDKFPEPNLSKERIFTDEFGFDVKQTKPKSRKPVAKRKNPIVTAKEWKSTIENGESQSRADLARSLGVSRTRVTQVLNLLKLSPEVIEALEYLGESVPQTSISEHRLRELVELHPEQQVKRLKEMLVQDGLFPLALRKRKSS